MFGNPVTQKIIRPFGTPRILGDFHVTAVFGAIDSMHPTAHEGVDIGDGKCGTDLLAMTSGLVTMAGGTFGTVRIASDDFPGYEPAIAHCAKIRVKVGDRVARGQVIASVGNTGVTQCHAHLGCKHNGVEVDIWPLLDQNQEEDMLKGTNIASVVNRQTTTKGNNTRFRSSPTTKEDNILVNLLAGDHLYPNYVVQGEKLGASANWYGGWAVTPKGIEFGYLHDSTVGPLAPIENLAGVPQARYDADVLAATASGRAAGIQAARDDLADLA